MSDQIKVSDEVRDLAKSLGIKVAKDGEASVGNENAYKDFLESKGIDLEVAESIRKAEPVFVAALSLAHGEASIEAMKKNKDLKQTTVSLPTLGKDTMVSTFVRSREGINPSTKESIVTYGQSTVKHDIHSTGTRGQLADVKKFLRQRSTEAFA